LHGAVVAAVLEFVLDAAAYLEPELRRDRQVAAVEQAVDVAPEQ
jgi:hypothetical protein